MEPATIIGLVVAFGAIVVAQLMEGANVLAIFIIPPMLLVIVGTAGAVLQGNTMATFMGGISWLGYALTAKKADPTDVIPPLVQLAEKARKEGLLSLESEMANVEDEFMRKGLQMAVDGTDPDDLYEILTAEIKGKKASAKQAASVWTDAGGYAPTIGILGTIFGLMTVLQNLSQPEKLGGMIAVAFVATLWGVMSSNVMFLPWAKRVTLIGNQEAARMEIMVEGILAIQAGANPRVVQTKLQSKILNDGPKAAPMEEAA